MATGKIPFGVHLRCLRVKRGLTLRQVEELAGVSNAYVSQIETGRATVPSPDVIRALASAYGCAYVDLMVRAGYLESEPSAAKVTDRDPVAEILSALAAVPKKRRLETVALALRAAIDGGLI